jgi:hypothetical protein
VTATFARACPSSMYWSASGTRASS